MMFGSVVAAVVVGALIGLVAESERAAARDWPPATARSIKRARIAARADLRRVLPGNRVVAASTGRCPPGTYLNGVRPSGEYVCRSQPPRIEPPDERRGVLVVDHAVEVKGRIRCADGDIAIAADYRTAACRGGGS